MPVLGGVEATKHIREPPISYPGVIIGITGDAGSSDMEQLIRAGVDAVLPKPVSKGTLLEMLWTHMRKRIAAASDDDASSDSS